MNSYQEIKSRDNRLMNIHELID